MAFNVFDDTVQRSVFFLLVIFTPICILITGLRFRTTQVTGRKVGPEDWLALGALFCFLAWAVCASFVLKHLNGRSDFVQLPIEEAKSALKMVWAMGFIFPVNQLAAKFSILFFYHRIFRVKRSHAIWIQVLGAVQICYSITVVVVNAFQCRPVQKYWDILMMDGWCINVGAFLAGAETINSLIDFAMALLAILMLRGLQTSGRTKLSLAFIFIIGALAGAIGFVKIGLAFNVTIHNQMMMGLWSTVQQACSVICCCAITLKPLFTQGEFFSRLASRFTSRGSRSKTSQNEGQGSLPHYVEFDSEAAAPTGYRSAVHADSLLGTRNAERNHNSVEYPMKTVKVEHTYEHV